MTAKVEMPTPPRSGDRTVRNHVKSNLIRAHATIFIVLLLGFTVLTFLITNAGLDDGPEHGSRVFITTLGTITGPLTGAISRGFQGCCLRFSLLMMAYCAPVLLAGTAIQFLRFPDRRWFRIVKLVLWTLGWFVWFAGGIISFGHALS